MADNYAPPLISIVISVYNEELTIVETLKSVLKQIYSNFEIIVVDDGSNKPVETFLTPFIGDNRIRIFRTKRSNANITRNRGIEEKRGVYIAMFDTDDLWMENYLQVCLTLLQETKADGLYGSLFLRWSLSHEVCNLPVFYARAFEEGESIVDYFLTTGYGTQISTFFTTTTSLKDICWDSNLIAHQDYDFVDLFQKRYRMVVKRAFTTAYFLSSGRTVRYETCIQFVEDNINDIDPLIYTRLTQLDINVNVFISYFRKEATRYKGCIT